MKIKGKIIDLINRRIFQGVIIVEGGRIKSVSECANDNDVYIMPGFIDAHVHIESSMVTPSNFAAEAVRHGTVAVVSDPHEIANVMGIEGVDFMVESGRSVPFKFFFGAPSCVPATGVESSGAVIGADEIDVLLDRDDIYFLSELMNYPGVLMEDEEVLKKINIAKARGKVIDGHAPGLRGEDLTKYINAGISTDHEASTIEEAREKIMKGMKILLREGSAARNLEALQGLYEESPDKLMLCCDDIHPEMLMERHIEGLVKRLLNNGHNLYDVLASASLNPVNHYGLDVGLLRKGDPADFIIVGDIKQMNILETWIDGARVYSNGRVSFVPQLMPAINRFNSSLVQAKELSIKIEGDNMRVIEVFDGDLYTGELILPAGDGKYLKPDTERDILKIVIKERYNDNRPAMGMIKGFGLKKGAFASSVAHDSHNILAVGTDDRSIAIVINELVKMKGGLAVYDGKKSTVLKLPIGGIMSDVPCGTIAREYTDISLKVKKLGCKLLSPFMTLAFMALLVIPELKLGDRGLFKIEEFKFVDIFPADS